MKAAKKNKSAKKVGMGMQAKAVSFNPKVRKLVMAPGGSLCPVEDLRNPTFFADFFILVFITV